MQAPDPTADTPPPQGSRSGTWLALAMLLIGGLAALGSWLFYRNLQRQPLELFGSENAALILTAPQAELLVLAPAEGDSPETLQLPGELLAVEEAFAVENAPGFSHVRNSLLNNASFDWQAPRGDCSPRWRYALRFSGQEEACTVGFDIDCNRLGLEGASRDVSLEPVADGLEAIFEDYLARRQAGKTW